MKINKRLSKVANYVSDNSNIIDVGCDHALLDIYLVENKKNINCIASDVNEGPLEQAKNNIKKYKFQNKIKTKLGDGIEPIEDNTDTVIISGMGGTTIINILNNKDKLINVKKVIVSPNNDFPSVRKQISKLGFKIVQEEMVLDRNKFYPIIVFEKGKKKLTKLEILYGTCVKQNADYQKYLFFLKNKLITKLNEIPDKYILKKLYLKKELKLLSRKIIE